MQQKEAAMLSRKSLLVATLLAVLALGSVAAAQWPSDPAQNLVIADKTSEQVLPKVAAGAGGGCYVGWFDLSSGSYEVYLQRLDGEGVEQWPHDGILVSDHPQLTSLVDWDLIADADNNAILVFTDARNGSDLDVYAYKIAPDGSFAWGPDGVTLSSNDDYEPSPVVAEASDGDLVFVWARLPESAGGSIMMQRLSAAGQERFAPGGISVEAPPGEKPGFVDIVPANDGDVIVSWVRDISTFLSYRHVRANKYSSTGTAVWSGPVSVYDAASVPIAHLPRLTADGAGGALVCWHSSPGSFFNSYVQHLDTAGAELLPHNGVVVSTTANMHHLDPSLSYNQDTGEAVVFWNERNSNQSQWGIYAQKLSAAGARAWGDGGLVLLPVNTIYKSFPRSLPAGDGAMVFLMDEPTGLYNEDRVIGMRLDATGHQVWPVSPLVVSSYLSGKSRLPVALASNGMAILVWEDDRQGTVDVYGQNVNPDGSLGASLSAAGESGTSRRPLLGGNHPNPFNPRTTISYVLPVRARVKLSIFDLTGSLVRTLVDEMQGPGAHTVSWSGIDGQGRPVPSGVYACRLEAGDSVETKSMVLIK
jgi:hypothetical protein